MDAWFLQRWERALKEMHIQESHLVDGNLILISVSICLKEIEFMESFSQKISEQFFLLLVQCKGLFKRNQKCGVPVSILPPKLHVT